MTWPVYIGYDPREHDAYEVCRASLLRRSSRPLHLTRLHRGTLEAIGMYRRGFHMQDGQRIDDLDGKPFSTEFSFSRFLVPALCVYQGWALFCDCDFLFLADPARLFDMADDRYAVMCVKHEHNPVEAMKMDGVVQTRYRRKNWSSLILWNCGHPSNLALGPTQVNRMPGAWLHAFDWLRDDEIGALPQSWNWLAGVGEPLPAGILPCAVHYTLGVPSMPGHEESPYADLWLAERDSKRAVPDRPLPSEWLRAIDLPAERHAPAATAAA